MKNSYLNRFSLLLFVAIFAVAVQSGCTLKNRLVRPIPWDSSTQVTAPTPLKKTNILELLVGKEFSDWSPEDFQADRAALRESTYHPDSQSFEFLLFADTQVHDRGLAFGKCTSRFVDKNPFKPIETTERNFFQDHADAVYLGFAFTAMRQMLEANTNLSFVLHLGDAMHVGLNSELQVFNEMVGKFVIANDSANWAEQWSGNWLETPIHLQGRSATFFNMLGNHDVLFMGNFNEHGPVKLPAEAIYSEESLRFALAATAPFNSTATPVFGNGTQAAGYYFRDRLMPDGKLIRLVVLNTNEKNILDPLCPNMQKGGLYPSISAEQALWLEQTLETAQADSQVGVVIVFGHNQLSQLTVNRTGRREYRDATWGELKKLIGTHDKVAAYISGHIHSGSPAILHQVGSRVLKEIIVPSLQEFPKSFAHARLTRVPPGQYDLTIEYYNLEDLVELDALAEVEVRDDRLQSQQQKFSSWMETLQSLAGDTSSERMRLLAKFAYMGSVYDVTRDLRKDVGITFHPKFAASLLEDYMSAQKVFEEMKANPVWAYLRKHFEGTVPTAVALQPITPETLKPEPARNSPTLPTSGSSKL